MQNTKFKELLNNRGLKATLPRLALLHQMDEYETAIPYSTIQEKLDNTDRVTLYRTIETLLSEGIIHKAFQENNETYYAICGKSCNKQAHAHNHIHFKCTNCESVTCEKVAEGINLYLQDFEIEQVNINVKGICKSCKVES